MFLTATEPLSMEGAAGSGWWLRGWASRRVMAGMTDRHTDLETLLRRLPRSVVTVAAEQVHGAGIAIVEQPARSGDVLPGCDALMTATRRVALLIRTADCLPLFIAAPSHGVVGVAHAGWRGLTQQLPLRLIGALRHVYHVPAEAVEVAIGPAIRACCYEVGAEFETRFPGAVRVEEGRRRCDLIDVAKAQLQQAGVVPQRIADTQRCTACETSQWFSLRREGPSTGRLTSLIMLRT